MPHELPSTHKQDINTKLAWCIHRAELAFHRTFPVPEISFKLRGKVAGKAYLQLNKIRLNPVLFKENYQAFIQEVIPHEVAHLITYQHFGKVRPHGREWQMVMEKVLRTPAKTTHNFEISSVEGETFEYLCACDSHHLSIRRHNRVQRKQANYLCKNCQQALVYVDSAT